MAARKAGELVRLGDKREENGKVILVRRIIVTAAHVRRSHVDRAIRVGGPRR